PAVTGKPAINRIIGGAGFSGQIGATESRCRCRRTVAGHVTQHAVHDEGIARIQYPHRLFAHQHRLGLRHQLAARVGDALDQVGCDLVSAIGKHRVSASHLARRDQSGTQRQGQVVGLLVDIKAEASHVVPRCLRRDGAQHADRHHVLRLGQRQAHRDRAVVDVVVIFRLPQRRSAFSRNGQRRIVDQRAGAIALFQRSRIDERLDAGTRLTPCLGDVIELAQVEIEATHQRAVGTALRVQRHECRRHIGQLDNAPLLLRIAGNADHRARHDAQGRRRFNVQAGRCKAQAVTTELDAVARQQRRPYQFRRSGSDHGGQ
ncbi:hypothetical protein IMCC9480_3529, partial [Oxalobacteraceae bacterium IMCC9480]